MTGRQKKNSRRMLLILAALLIAGLAVGFLLLMQQESSDAIADESRQSPMLVRTVTAEQTASINLPRTFTGILKAGRTSDLGFERTGRLQTIAVQEGDRVEPGDVLAKLDTDSLSARRTQAVAQRDAAKAMLDELIAGPRAEAIASAQAVVEDQQSQLQLAQADFKRMQALAQSDSISQQEFDRAQFSLASVEGKLQSALSQLEELESGTRQEQLSAQQAQVAQFEAAIKTLDVEIRESTMLAPYEAIVSRRDADEGSIVSATAPILRLVETGKLEAWIGLPQELCRELQDGAYETQIQQKSYPAMLLTRLPELDPVTRTQTAIFRIDDVGGSLVPGLVARIDLSEPSDVSGYWLPTRSLTRGQRGLWSVYVVAANEKNERVAMRRDVEILYTDSERVLVRGTITDGDLVIADGTHRIAPGQRVVAARRAEKEPDEENSTTAQSRTETDSQNETQPQAGTRSPTTITTPAIPAAKRP